MNSVQQTIIREARTWIGTPFRHQGRVKINNESRGGCDCLGLVMGIASSLKLKSRATNPPPLISNYDIVNYPKIPNASLLIDSLSLHLYEIDLSTIEPADVVVIKFDNNPQHLALIADYPTPPNLGLIHCYLEARKVVEHILDTDWQNKLVKAYRFLDVLTM